MPKVAAVILNYNSHKDLEKCINSIRKNVTEKIEIIIVDNNSKKESVDYIQSQINDIIFLKRNINDGYAAGNNEGIRKAISLEADYVLIMNPDIIVKDNFLAPLVKILIEKPEVGIVTGKAFRKISSEIYTTGGRISLLLCSVLPLYSNKIYKPQFVNFISGCLMIVRKEVFHTVGYFEERYFMYSEDLKYSFNVNKHFKLYYQPESVFYHGSGAGNILEEYLPSYLYYSIRNRILFFTDAFPFLKYYVITILLLIIFVKLILLVFSMKGNDNRLSQQIIALVNGWIDGAKGIMGRNPKY